MCASGYTLSCYLSSLVTGFLIPDLFSPFLIVCIVLSLSLVLAIATHGLFYYKSESWAVFGGFLFFQNSSWKFTQAQILFKSVWCFILNFRSLATPRGSSACPFLSMLSLSLLSLCHILLSSLRTSQSRSCRSKWNLSKKKGIISNFPRQQFKRLRSFKF